MRLLTILSVLTVSLITCIWGIGVTEFSWARATVTLGNVTNLSSWAGFPGVTAEALDGSFRDEVTATATKKVADLTAVLAIRPLSARDWLALAGTRFALGRPMSEVNDALAMSWVVGPNEGVMMWRRALFGVSLWEMLTPDGKRQAIADIAGCLLDGAASDQDILSAKALFAKKPEEARMAIGRGLQVAGVSADQLKELGLHAEAG